MRVMMRKSSYSDGDGKTIRNALWISDERMVSGDDRPNLATDVLDSTWIRIDQY